LKERRTEPKSLSLYAFLHAATLCVSWGWFAGLWAVAIYGGYTPGDFEWWLLAASGLAGFYGLRPNLERAIDSAWLKGVDNQKLLQERVAQLRPIKRRIDLVFTLVVLGLLVVFAALIFTGVLNMSSV
jgi:hypothetical protein